MLFLYNQTVLEILEPYETAKKHREALGIGSLARLTLTDVRVLIGKAAMQMDDLEKQHPEKAAALAALVMIKTNANALLIHVPHDCQSLSDVTLRFGSLPLPTIVQLFKLQEAGRLSPARCNAMVWAKRSAA